MISTPRQIEPQSPSRSIMLTSRPTALTDFKITRQLTERKEQSPRKASEKIVPGLRELKPALSEQFHLLKYLRDVDDRIDNAFELHEMRIKARHHRILQMTSDL